MNWKAQLGIGLLIVAVAVAGVWLWRDSVWRGRIQGSPADTAQTVNTVRDTIRVPVIRADTVYVSRVDSTHTAPRWWIAKADTVIDGARLHVEYNSPLPLSPRGFFSDLEVQLPPRIDSVRTVTVTVTRTVIDERIAWEYIAGAGAVGIIAGVLIHAGAQ